MRFGEMRFGVMRRVQEREGVRTRPRRVQYPSIRQGGGQVFVKAGVFVNAGRSPAAPGCRSNSLYLLVETFSHAHAFLDFISERIIEPRHGGIRCADLQIDLRAAHGREKIFSLSDQRCSNSLPLVRLKDRRRVEPPSMTIVASHD